MKLYKRNIKFNKMITVKMLLVFALSSALWVLLSNKILSLILNLSSELTKIFIYNGWLYAVVTALIFYFLISKYNMHIYEEAKLVTDKKIQKNIRKWPWYLIILILLFSLGIFQIDTLYYKIQKAEYKEESENELKSISELKVKYIDDWRNERFKNTEILLSNPIINNRINEFLKNSDKSKKQEEINSFFKTILADSNYSSIKLYDVYGNSVLRVGLVNYGSESLNKTIFNKINKENRQILSDFRINKTDPKKLSIDLFVPVFNCEEYDTVLTGIVQFEINPDKYLFPNIKSWPTNSISAESILLRCENDSLSFLSPPRTSKLNESNSKRHILKSELAGIDLRNISSTIIEAKDYRDKKTLAVVNKISGTNWYLITKIDQEEIYSDLLKSAKLFTILIVLVILAGGISIILYWRKHIAKHYRKQYETELEKLALARNFEYMTKYANDIIFLTDEEWNIVEVNEKAILTYGYTRKELLDKKIFELRTNSEKELFYNQFEDLNNFDGKIIETVHERKDGSKFNVESSVRMINIDGNKFYQGILRDITERKIAENELKKAKDKAEEMNRLKSNFLMNMGHELRTPLNGVIGYADLLNDELENNRQKEMMDIIIQGGKRLTRTVNSILDLTVIESNEVKVNLKTIDLAKSVKESISQFEVMLKNKKLTLKTSFEESVYANLDAGSVNRIIYNLIHNAIAFTNEGCIKLKVGKEKSNEKDYAYFSVTDTGIGIHESNFKTIFEPFRQVSEGINRNYEGAGLGLTITKKYTELMNGIIQLKSLVGVGSEFKVMFPLVENKNTIAYELREVAVQAKNIINKTSNNKRILILNGNQDLISAKSNILKCICKTDTVDSEEAALEIAKKNNYDVILMELGINNKNRLQVAQKIRQIQGYESIPILAITDSGVDKSKDTCLQAGCSHYFSKPFQLKELIQMVNQLLGNN